jgi:hypothetical protein
MNAQQVQALPEEQKPAPLTPPAPVQAADVPFKHVEFGPDFRPVEHGKGNWVIEGRHEVEVKSPDGDKSTAVVWSEVSNTVFWVEGWTKSDAAGDPAQLMVHAYQHGHVSRYQAKGGLNSSMPQFLEFVGNNGITVPVNPKLRTMAMEHMNYQFNRATKQIPRNIFRMRFGLQFDGDMPDSPLVCLHGKHLLREDGSIEEVALAGKLANNADLFDIGTLPASKNGRWSPAVWNENIIPGAKQQVLFFRRYYEASGRNNMQLAVMMSLASPLLMFSSDSMPAPGRELPALGLTIALYSSGSGKGKSSLQEACAAAYGNPTALVTSGGKASATTNYRYGKAAVLGTMPFFLDEVTSNGPVEVADLIDRVAQGKEKGRSDQKGSPRHLPTWALTAMVSTNIPQRELLAQKQVTSDALQMRLIELTCEYEDFENGAHVTFKEDRDKLLFPNYGCLGACIELAILKNGPGPIRDLVQEKFKEVSELIPGSTQRERFMQRGMACALACHFLLEKMGIGMFDKKVLLAEYGSAVKSALAHAARVSRKPLDLLKLMISDFAPHIIVTERNVVKEGFVERVINEKSIRQPIKGRRIKSDGSLFLTSRAVHAWCAENQCSCDEIIRHGLASGVIRRFADSAVRAGLTRNITLTSNTDMSQVREPCYTFDEIKLLGESE